MTPHDTEQFRAAIIEAIRTVQDPEIPVNLYDLGLIYDLDIGNGGDVHIRMTLTTPNCPVAESMPGMVRKAVAEVEGVGGITIDLVWEPPWTRDRMSEDARAALDMMGIVWKDPRSGPSTRTTSLTLGRTGDDRRREK